MRQDPLRAGKVEKKTIPTNFLSGRKECHKTHCTACYENQNLMQEDSSD